MKKFLILIKWKKAITVTDELMRQNDSWLVRTIVLLSYDNDNDCMLHIEVDIQKKSALNKVQCQNKCLSYDLEK